MPSAIWPLFDLEVSTSRLSMRYVTDDLAERLAELAAAGLHEPATMPFSRPWTDLEPPELQYDLLRYFWRSRAETTPEHWEINLAVFDQDHHVVGRCVVHADQFLTTATAATGSWLGRRYQGQGLGREMRHAVLHLLFAGLDGQHAVTHAWHDKHCLAACDAFAALRRGRQSPGNPSRSA